jgi:hypothetical protein
MHDRPNAERKVWQKPEVLQTYSEEELDALMRGHHDLRVHGAGNHMNGSFSNRNDS